MLFYYKDKENKAGSLREEGFKDSLSLTTVIRCPVWKTKLSMECLSVKRGHFHPTETHRSALGLRPRREGWRSQIPEMPRKAQAQARQVLMHKMFTPTNAHSHLCMRGSLNTAPKKAYAWLASSTSSALFP